MAMEKKYCVNCARTAWHNPTKEPTGRCTFCGHPVKCGSPGSSKREYANFIRDTQARKKVT